MSDTFSTSLVARKQETGANENTWGDLLNTDVIDVFDNAIAGRYALATTGGTTTLTQAQHNSAIIDITGTLSSNAIVQVLNLSKMWLVRNANTGSFTTTFKTSGGSASDAIPQGATALVWCDGSNVVRVGIIGNDELAAIIGLTTAADKLTYWTGAGTAALADFPSFGRSVAAAASAAAARVVLGTVIGTDVQAFNANLATIASTITAAGLAILDDASAAAQLVTLGIAFASQAEAEAGTNATAFMNALRTAQAIAALNPFKQLLHVRDEKPSGTAAETVTLGAWRTRTINTSKTNEISGASLGSNQITLPAGTYEIDADVPAGYVSYHKAKLYNVSDAADVIIGSSEFTSGGAQYAATTSRIRGRFTIASTKVFDIRHQVAATNVGGAACSLGVVEVYTEVIIRKVG